METQGFYCYIESPLSRLTGFTGGLAIKQALLELEGIPYRADS